MAHDNMITLPHDALTPYALTQLRGYAAQVEAVASDLALTVAGSLSAAGSTASSIWRELFALVRRALLAARSQAGLAAEEATLQLRLCEQKLRKASRSLAGEFNGSLLSGCVIGKSHGCPDLGCQGV